MDRRMGLIYAADNGGDIPIPAGYERVKYLESNGNQGALIKNIPWDWDGYVCFRTIISYTTNSNVYNYYEYSGGLSLGVKLSPSIITIGYRRRLAISGDYAQGLHEIISDINGDVWFDGTKIGHHAVESYASLTAGIGLLCFNGNNRIYDTGAGKSSLFELYKNDILVVQAISVIRTSDGKPFFYDTVSEQFFDNKGSGEFGYEKLDGTYVAPI